MQISRICYFLLSSILLLITGCSTVHQQMQPATADFRKLQQFKPVFTVALYNTQVDVAGNHLSGLLLIKRMPDSSLRMLFSNEMGFKFFDFEFGADGKFKVHSVIKQMNRKAVLKTLKNDLALILMERMDISTAFARKNNGLLYHIFPQKKGYHYYITDSSGNELVRLERASGKKIIAETVMLNYINGIPDTIGISHKTFEFNIGLKRIER